MAWRAQPLLLAACACAVIACRPEAERVAAAAELAEPHLASFRRFDRWARRALAGAASPRDRGALGEVVFAPIRATPELLAAWVSLAGERPQTLALPEKVAAPAAPRWVALRDAELGALQVAAHAPCPLSLPARWRPDPIAGCVLITRAAVQGSAARVLTVTLAFRNPN